MVKTLKISSNFIIWRTNYVNNHYLNKKTKLKSFQIRLNLRSIIANAQLVGFGIFSSELCTFRSKHPETLYHLYLDYNKFRKFWKVMEDWISSKLRVIIVLNKIHKQFGFHDKSIGFQFLKSLLFCEFVVYILLSQGFASGLYVIQNKTTQKSLVSKYYLVINKLRLKKCKSSHFKIYDQKYILIELIAN